MNNRLTEDPNYISGQNLNNMAQRKMGFNPMLSSPGSNPMIQAGQNVGNSGGNGPIVNSQGGFNPAMNPQGGFNPAMNPQGGYNPNLGGNNQIYGGQIQNSGIGFGPAGRNPNVMNMNNYQQNNMINKPFPQYNMNNINNGFGPNPRMNQFQQNPNQNNGGFMNNNQYNQMGMMGMGYNMGPQFGNPLMMNNQMYGNK